MSDSEEEENDSEVEEEDQENEDSDEEDEEQEEEDDEKDEDNDEIDEAEEEEEQDPVEEQPSGREDKVQPQKPLDFAQLMQDLQNINQDITREVDPICDLIDRKNPKGFYNTALEAKRLLDEIEKLQASKKESVEVVEEEKQSKHTRNFVPPQGPIKRVYENNIEISPPWRSQQEFQNGMQQVMNPHVLGSPAYIYNMQTAQRLNTDGQTMSNSIGSPSKHGSPPSKYGASPSKHGSPARFMNQSLPMTYSPPSRFVNSPKSYYRQSPGQPIRGYGQPIPLQSNQPKSYTDFMRTQNNSFTQQNYGIPITHHEHQYFNQQPIAQNYYQPTQVQDPYPNNAYSYQNNQSNPFLLNNGSSPWDQRSQSQARQSPGKRFSSPNMSNIKDAVSILLK